jgi:hypothetical protein
MLTCESQLDNPIAYNIGFNQRWIIAYLEGGLAEEI